jgi:hypothetical protein
MTTVLDSLPEKFRGVYMREIAAHDPNLLTRLLNNSEPTRGDRQAVEDILSTSFMHHLSGNEPTEAGVTIEDALDAFLSRWPIERG